ncbi:MULTISPECIES: hypothetical protein [Niastella]|uniref:Uncharacterized protein n=1 Tax=Niastella soli TaxID=2821487 RepID=A0ABS3YZM1_9BACT|nr:hypothetical protein [Niastella soli]MBO9203374.1 hypothetical protein [Niastella soli]
MENTKKGEQKCKAKKVDPKAAKDYINDPYFVKKREIAAAFLKKVGLPESFTKQQDK